MDYKKKYEQALDNFKKIKAANKDNNELVDFIEYEYPELKESKDEKIRKELIHFLEEVLDLGKDANFNKYCKSDCAGWIAWIEKQGSITILSEEEQNKFAKGVLTSCAISFINYLDAHKYEGKMCVSNGECEDIENAFHNAMWDRLHRYYCKYIEKQGEQKPAWSKEDEKRVESLRGWLDTLALYIHHDPTVPLDLGRDRIQEVERLKTWLKSLKDRYTWKPTDKQMKELLSKLPVISGCGDAVQDILESLYQDLKKLREE